MKRICCCALLGILLVGLLGGCGGKKYDIAVLTPEDIKMETPVLQEEPSEDSYENPVAEDAVSSEPDEAGSQKDSDAEAGKADADYEKPENTQEPEAKPAVEEDEMPRSACVYCGGEAVYVSGAWSCFDCAAVYLEEEISAILQSADPEASRYIGEYLDQDVNEPNLEIAKGDDGKFIVQVGIYRLAALTDGVGELTAEGLKFTATDPAGNPISGVVKLAGQIATVTFTDSSWADLGNGTSFQYTKSSDTPNIWNY